MTGTIKLTVIIVMAVSMNGIGFAEGGKNKNGNKTMKKVKTTLTSGQGNISLKDEPKYLYLFPLTKAILNEL